MSTEKTAALVIRLADFSETSRVVTLFTRDFGKVAAIAKGAKRLKGPFEAALDLLAACQIVFIRKSTSGLDILTEAQLTQRFQPSGRDLVRLYGGYYVAELLDALTEEHDPHPELFDEAIAALELLSGEGDAVLPVTRFELAVLREIGQLPSFDECVVCGELVANVREFGYWVSQGGLICERCQKEEYKRTQIRSGTVAVLRRLGEPDGASIRNLVVSREQWNEIRPLVVSAISHVMGRRPKMLKYLNF